MSLRRSLVAVGLAGLALLAAAPARAVPFTGAFAPLIADLEFRRDNDFRGELDRTGKKQLAAINKALAHLEKPADDLGDDLKTAGKVAGVLQKAFPDEFGGAPQGDLSDLLVLLFGDLQGFVDEDFADLEGDLPGLSDRGKAKVQAVLDRAAEGLGEEYDEFSLKEWGKALASAYRSIVKGEKVVAKDPGPTGTLLAEVDGVPVGANEVVVAYSGGVVSLLAIRAKNPPKTISCASQEITGTGTYSLVVGSHTVGPETNSRFYILQSGTMTIESIDLVARLVSFSFSYTAVDASEDTVTVTGSYSGPFTVPM